MSDIDPYDELEYEPETIRNFLGQEHSFQGYAEELYKDLDKHFEAYEIIYEESQTKMPKGLYVDAENFDKAKAELEIANKVMERLVIDLQNRDGAYGVKNCEIVYDGKDEME